MAASSQTLPDLGERRGLSRSTLQLFNVRNNGTGWEWDTRTMDGKTATRWKSYSSTKPPGDDTWKKYAWVPEKPPTAKYFYPPRLSLSEVVADSGILYMVGGEIAAMSMFEAGFQSVTCTFGDSSVPDTIAKDLLALGVKALYLIPDRDNSGQQWAATIRDRILADDASAMEIEIIVLALPFPLEEKHGSDVNDLWLNVLDKAEFQVQLSALPVWHLPEPEPKTIPLPTNGGEDEIPENLKSDLRRLLGVTERYNGGGWSRKNVRCPFHNDAEPSATWNDEKAILYCHAGCNRSYLAKELCEHFGLRMADYYDTSPTLERKPHLPTVQMVEQAREPIKRHSPLLPSEAELTLAQAQEAATGRRWLTEYVDWAAKAGALSPAIFYESMGMWTLATAAARRLRVTIGGRNIYPNLYIFIVAPTTVYRKTTALNLATSVLEAANLDCLLLPERATPEALFEYLAGRTPMNFDQLSEQDRNYWAMGRTFAGQRAILEDEASGLLSEMKKDYMTGLSELVLKGYDGQGTLRKLLKSQGLMTVKDMCLSFLAATTPIEWSRRMGQEERQNGFVARFGIITPEQSPIWLDETDEVALPNRVVQCLKTLFLNTLPWDERCISQDGTRRALAAGLDVETPPIVSVSIAPEAFKQYQKYNKALNHTMLKDSQQGGEVEADKAGSYSRLVTMLVKNAMLLAAVDTETATVRIEARHMYAAQQICERWRESLHRLDHIIAESKYDGIDEKVLKFIRSSGTVGVTMRDICRASNLEGSEAEKKVKLLVDAGAVEMFKREHQGKGRPALCYKVSQ